VTCPSDDTGRVENPAGVTSATVRVLAGDLVRFTLTLAFYPVCWLAGNTALLLDRIFGSDMCARFLTAVEYVDQGRP
jgi:hypothetical protein